MSEAVNEGRALEGRAALVTGASSGLRRAAAITLARAGADVALVARSAKELQSAKENGKGRVVARPGDDLRIGGGELSGLGSGTTSAETFGQESNVLKECRRGNYWSVGTWESLRPSKRVGPK